MGQGSWEGGQGSQTKVRPGAKDLGREEVSGTSPESLSEDTPLRPQIQPVSLLNLVLKGPAPEICDRAQCLLSLTPSHHP